jgi:hypothetical protein
MDHILTFFGLREMISAGLKITKFCLSYMHQAPRQVRHTKYYQNYYPKLRRNIVGVLMDQILTTHMNVPGMEPTYASAKGAHVLLIYYIKRKGYFRVE